MQGLVDGVFLLRRGDFVESEFALLGCGEGAWFLCVSFAGFFFALGEGAAADGARRGCGGCCADCEGALGEAVVVVRCRGFGGEGALEERLAEGQACGLGHGGVGGEGAEVM